MHTQEAFQQYWRHWQKQMLNTMSDPNARAALESWLKIAQTSALLNQQIYQQLMILMQQQNQQQPQQASCNNTVYEQAYEQAQQFWSTMMPKTA